MNEGGQCFCARGSRKVFQYARTFVEWNVFRHIQCIVGEKCLVYQMKIQKVMSMAILRGKIYLGEIFLVYANIFFIKDISTENI